MARHRKYSHRRQHIALAVLALLDAPLAAWALPQGGTVVAGDVTVGAPVAGQLGIVQSSTKAVVDWHSFSIARGESVSLAQPLGGAALFRVTGGDPSQIFGSLRATGRLFLSNPNGVLFGANSQVDVGSLVATTLGVANGDFLAGRYRFAGDSRASVANEGRINAAEGGSVVLLGADVANSGTITAPQGSVALGAASAATLDVYGNGLLRLNLTEGADGARVDHAGTTLADGGVVSLATRGRVGGMPAAINMSGLVRAQSLTAQDGAIYLSGGIGSTLAVSGTLDTSSATAGARAGRIDVSGERIGVSASAQLLANAARTGAGNGGSVDVIATDSMQFDGTITARGGTSGGDGGNAEVSGHAALHVTGFADLSAPAGAFGTLLLDPWSIVVARDDAALAGPAVFSDSALSRQLGAANVVLTTRLPNTPLGPPDDQVQNITVLRGVNITWAAPTTLRLEAGGSIGVEGDVVIRNTSASTTFDALVFEANQLVPGFARPFAGIELLATSRLETTGGGIRLAGRGGPAGNGNVGIRSSGSIVTANGQITLTGQGGGDAASSGNAGVVLLGGAGIVASGSGRISVTGVGGAGAGSVGLLAPIGAALTLSTQSGTLDLVGVAGNPSELALQVDSPAARIGSSGGTVTVRADTMRLSPGARLSSTGTVVLAPLLGARNILIGAADTPTALGLDPSDLQGVSAGRLEIGNTSAGDIRVSAPYTPVPLIGTLALVSGFTVSIDAALTGVGTRLSLNGTMGVRLGAALTSTASNVASTRAITIRSALGTFTNNVGAAALSTPNGSWAVSLRTPVGSNFNGLLSGNLAVWNNPVTSNVNPTGNRYAFALPPTIFVNAASAAKTYGEVLSGTATLAGAAVSAVANTFGGAFSDYQTGTVSGSYARASAGLAGSANAGSYALTIADSSQLTTSKPGYGFALGGAGTLTVAQRPVTLTPEVATRIYGDANPATGAATATTGSLANGDTVGSVGLSSPALVASNVGSYGLSATSVAFSTGLASNYVVTFGTLSNGLTIAPRPVSLAPAAVSRIYGDGLPARGAASLAAGNLVGSDALGDVALSSAATAASFVGNYALSASDAALRVGNAANYVITYTDRVGGLTVTQRPVTLTLQGSVSRPYGGGALLVGVTSPVATAGSLAAGDSVGGYTANFPGPGLAAPVGSYATSLVAVDLRNAANQPVAANYTLTLAGAPYRVTPRPVTLTPVQLSRTYGEANPGVASVTSDAGFGVGLVNGDAVAQVALASTATLASNVGLHSTTGNNAVFSAGAASNYAVTHASNASGLNITPRGLTLAPVAVSRVYGDANPANAAATASQGGLVNGDTVASVALATPATLASNVGSYGTTASNAVFGSGLATNYAIAYTSNAAGLAITPRAVTLTPDVVSRSYGDINTTRATVTGNAGGLVNGDTVAGVSLTSSATAASNVGRYDTTASNAVFGNGLATNYAITYAPNPTGLQVTPRALTLTPDPVSRIYGDNNPASGTATGNAGGLVNGDSVASVTLASSATAASHVGGYDTAASNALFGTGLASNYTVAYAASPAGLNITPRAMVVTPDTTTRAYGETNPSSGTAGGNNLVNGDRVAGVTLTSSATVASHVGSYDTTATNAIFGSGLATDYSITYAPNASGLAVTPRVLTLTPDAVSRTYGDANPARGTASGNVGGLVNGDGVSGVALASSATATSNVGSYATMATNAIFGAGLATDYRIAYAPNPTGLTVTPRALLVTPDATTRVYGDANPTSNTAGGNNLVNGDTLVGVTLTSAATATSNVGSYATTATNAIFGNGLASNYTIAYAPNAAGLAVTPRSLTLTPDVVSRIYGESNPANGTATGNVDGLLNGDRVAGITLASNATATSNVGSYSTTATNAVFGSGLASNYTITYTPNANGLTVTPRALVLTPEAVSRSYGDANPATATASAAAGGLVNGDSVASVAITSTAQAGSGIGSYATTADNAAFGSGAATNYSIRYTANATGLLVMPRNVAVAALPGQGKLLGRSDSALTYALTGGSVVAGDAFSGSLVRAPGELPGAYVIDQGNLTLGPNYALAYAPANFTVSVPVASATVDRTPAVGTPNAAGTDFAALLASLPPTAAGTTATELPTECVREAALAAAGSVSRIVNRGMRLPQGVTDSCRPGAL